MAEEPSAPPRAPVGMRDVLWPETARWAELVSRFAARAGSAGYRLLVTPVVEEARLFRRGVGEGSEVVTKEMYEFTDRGGRQLALRPEGTAPVVRAFVQHRPPQPFKAWYLTPAFRYERPQAGRYRQHHQLGVEALGSDDPDLDVEVVTLAARFYDELGLRSVELAVNSMGCADCRPGYLQALVAYLDQHAGELCDEHRHRYRDNPLRVLDCKRPPCRQATADAPRMVDFLDARCAAHFDRVRSGLESLGVDHHLEPRLVRGLDYYTRTTFEFADVALEAAQNAVGGGGRYDGLAEAIGGPPTPGIGFGMGIERLLLACDAERCFVVGGRPPEVFVVDVAGGDSARDLTDELRSAGLSAERAFDGRSLKAQLRLADRSGAAWAVVVGPAEMASGTVQVKDLRGERPDRTVDRARLLEAVSAPDETGQGGERR